MLLLIVTLVFVITVLYYLINFFTDPCKLPGPIGLPIVGFFPFLGPKPHEKFAKLGEKYGEIYQLWLGNRRVVVLNSYELLKDALNRSEFAHRPKLIQFDIINSVGRGSFGFMPYTPRVQYLRKASMRALSNFVISKDNKLEQYSNEAFQEFAQVLDANDQKPINPRQDLLKAVATVIGSLSFGREVYCDAENFRGV